jgi:cytochrome P450
MLRRVTKRRRVTAQLPNRTVGRMNMPADPIAAATHRDPYPYYAALVAQRPLHRDERLGLWIASSAEAVTAVLESAHARVRPPAEPVPAAIVGTHAGEIFRRLVRQNDGERHAPYKPAVSTALRAIEAATAAQATTCARELDTTHVTDFMFRLSSFTIAALLGAPRERWDAVATWTGDFVRGIAPGATAEQIAQGGGAAANLLALFGEMRTQPNLLGRLSREAPADAAETALANGVGFLSQAYEATAGLIGNTLLALARMPELRAAPLVEVVREVARHDSPVHNTRRFMAADTTIAGQSIRAGDAILVLLAAANRDPAANPDPDRFDLARPARRSFTFGHAVHVCPGEIVATAIATAGVERLLAGSTDVRRLAENFIYRSSPNTRIPLFD